MKDRFAHPLWLLLILPVAWVCLWRHLGLDSLRVTDEACHTDVARNILIRGQWIDLQYFDNLYNGKPPLKIWLTALLMKAFGQSEWVIRAPDATFGTIATILVWLIVRGRAGGPAIVATPLIFVMAAYPLASHCWREAVQDGALVMLTTLAVLLFLRTERSPRWFLAVGATLGAASLVKSVAAWLLWLPIGAFLLVRRRHRELLSVWLIAGGLLTLAPWLLWFARHTYGESLIGAEWKYNIQDRWERLHPHSPWEYWVWLYYGFKPWGPALPVAGLGVAAAAAAGSVFDRWVLLWGLGLGLPWLFPTAKHPWYMYPAYPAVAFALARLVFPPELWKSPLAWPADVLGALRLVLRVVLRLAGTAAFLVVARMSFLQAWHAPVQQTLLKQATDWFRGLPPAPANLPRYVGVWMPMRRFCPDERYYVDRMGGATRILTSRLEAVSMASDPDRPALLLIEHPELHGLLAELQRARDVAREVRVLQFAPEIHAIRVDDPRSENPRLPDRVLLAVGLAPPSPPFSPPQLVSFGDGFRHLEGNPGAYFSWLESRGKLRLGAEGCGVLRLRLRSYHRAHDVTVRLGAQESTLRATTDEADFAVPLEAPPGGGSVELEADGPCVSPREVEPGNTDRRCLGVSVSDLRWEPEARQAP